MTSHNQVTVYVEGPYKSGKTQIANIIRGAVGDFGVDVFERGEPNDSSAPTRPLESENQATLKSTLGAAPCSAYENDEPIIYLDVPEGGHTKEYKDRFTEWAHAQPTWNSSSSILLDESDIPEALKHRVVCRKG